MFITPRPFRGAYASLCVAVAALATLPLDTLASTALTSPKYQTECAACHIAYPPGMLPAASWRRLVGGLNKHFGVDASLDAASTAEIEDWLKGHAGSFKHVNEEPPQDRISKSKWFVRQHDEVPAAVWKRKAVGGPSNCSACHANAGKGHFNEDDVRIPK
jgi:cytochrome c553